MKAIYYTSETYFCIKFLSRKSVGWSSLVLRTLVKLRLPSGFGQLPAKIRCARYVGDETRQKKLEKDLFATDCAILRPTDTENEETDSIRCAILCSAKE